MLRPMTALLLLGPLTALPALAQTEVCSGATSLSQCIDEGYQAALQAPVSVTVSAQAAKADAEVRTALTSSSGDSTTQGISLTNFLSPFLALVDSGGLTSQGERIAIEIAARLLDDLDKDTKFQVVFNEAELFAPLRMKLEEEMLATTIDQLERSLDDTDDLTFKLSWSPVNQRYGRSIEHHRQTLTGLFDERIRSTFSASDEARSRALAQLFTDFLERCPQAGDPSAVDFSCLTAADRQKVFDAGKTLGEQNEAFRKAVDGAGLFEFGRLLNNQPQIVASASYRSRAETAGPDETSVELRYEQGVVNVNSMLKACKGKPDLLACYTEYVGNPRRAASLKANNRVAFSLEYTDIDAAAITVGDQLLLEQPGSSSLVASLTYGRYIWVIGEESARIDASVMFDQADDDAGNAMTGLMESMMRQDRVLASLTYTQKLNDKTGAVLGLTWANKPEYLGDVDKKFGARAGLTYKILGGGEN